MDNESCQFISNIDIGRSIHGLESRIKEQFVFMNISKTIEIITKEFDNIFENNPNSPSNTTDQKNLLLSADIMATKAPQNNDSERFSFG